MIHASWIRALETLMEQSPDPKARLVAEILRKELEAIFVEQIKRI